VIGYEVNYGLQMLGPPHDREVSVMRNNRACRLEVAVEEGIQDDLDLEEEMGMIRIIIRHKRITITIGLKVNRGQDSIPDNIQAQADQRNVDENTSGNIEYLRALSSVSLSYTLMASVVHFKHIIREILPICVSRTKACSYILSPKIFIHQPKLCQLDPPWS